MGYIRRLTQNHTYAMLSTSVGGREVGAHGGRARAGSIEGLRAGPDRDPQADPGRPGHRVRCSPPVASARGGDPSDPRASESSPSPAGDPEGHRLHLRSIPPRPATGARGRAEARGRGVMYVLDTSALMRFLRAEPGADDVHHIMGGGGLVLLPFITIMEVDYVLRRILPPREVETHMVAVRGWPATIVESSPEWGQRAAEVKSHGGPSA